MQQSKQTEKELSLVCYDLNGPPRYFKINRNLIRFVVFGPPIIAVLIASILIVGLIYFDQLKDQLKQQQFSKVEELRTITIELEKNIVEKEGTITTLQEKLSNDEASDGADLPVIFQRSIGQKDLTNTNSVSIEKNIITYGDDKATLTFNLVNNTNTGARVSGYIFVIFNTTSEIKTFPKNIFAAGATVAKFNAGEPFTTFRFRPVVAEFKVSSDTKPYFSVVVFSRSGDILFYKQLSKD